MPIVGLDTREARTETLLEKRRFFRALVADKVDKLLLDGMRELGIRVDLSPGITREELLARIGEYEIVVVRSRTKIDKEVIAKAARLKIIVRAGSGLDNIDVEEARKRGITILNAPEASVNSVAELTIGLVLAAARRIVELSIKAKNGVWEKGMGIEVRGRKLGIVGFGKIGRRVAELARALGMDVIVYDVRDVEEVARMLGARAAQSLEELLREADIVTLHVPLTPETYHMIDRRELEMMRDGTIIINTSRGAVVNTKALLEALEKGKIAAAALDVLEHEPPREEWELKLVQHPRVIVTPHIGAQTPEAQRRVAEVILAKLSRVIEALQGGNGR